MFKSPNPIFRLESIFCCCFFSTRIQAMFLRANKSLNATTLLAYTNQVNTTASHLFLEYLCMWLSICRYHGEKYQIHGLKDTLTLKKKKKKKDQASTGQRTESHGNCLTQCLFELCCNSAARQDYQLVQQYFFEYDLQNAELESYICLTESMDRWILCADTESVLSECIPRHPILLAGSEEPQSLSVILNYF